MESPANLRDEERAELLNAGAKAHATLSGSNVDSSSDSESESQNACHCDAQKATSFGIDLAIAVPFYYVLLFVAYPDDWFLAFLIGLVVSMVLWRLYRAYGPQLDSGGVDIPYTVAYAANSGKEVYLVATLHISPRAPRDVKLMIETSNPDVAMIELDEERLDRMRDPDEVPVIPEPKPEDLQKITIKQQGGETITVLAQRAIWNAEWAGESRTGDLVFDEENAHGLAVTHDSRLAGNMALVKRGGANNEWAPFALKAHIAAKNGAQAVLVMGSNDQLPLRRLGGGGSVPVDLKIAWNTGNCGYPQVPVFLLQRKDGDRLEALCNNQAPPAAPVTAEFEIMSDHYPRRTLRMRLCQACCLMFTGIGILYGVIQCFSVEVGAEFTVAESTAKARGIPCACIDVNLNRFWSRLGKTVCPTPCNFFNAIWCWLCFPRVAFHALFPPRDKVDVLGGMFLHAASFSINTWVAFLLAGFCASQITSRILDLCGYGATKAAESTGAVKEEDRAGLQDLLMLCVQMYILPQVYTGIAASRDEAMYQSIVKKSNQLEAKRMVVVVGAAHSNGILQRIQDRGL